MTNAIPKANEHDHENGWTIDLGFLNAVTDLGATTKECQPPSLEEAENVILSLIAMEKLTLI